jgi:hypothetical protein
MGFDLAIVRDPVGRDFDLWVGRKGDPERMVRIAIFLPILRDGGIGENEYCGDEDERSHSCALQAVRKVLGIATPTTLRAARRDAP